MKKICLVVLLLGVSLQVHAEDQYVFRVAWPEKTLIADYGPTNGIVSFFSEDRSHLSIVVTKEQYDMGWTNLSISVVSNAISIANDAVAEITKDQKLKAVIEGLVFCINKRIPSNKITADELKEAIKERLK